VILASLLACASGLAVDERLVSWDENREALTAAYLEKHCGDCSTTNKPTVIVLHGTGAASMDALHARFDAAELPADRRDLAWAGTVNVSTHFGVDRDGTITRFLADHRVGRHTVGLNHTSIGIENLGDGPEHDLTEAQVVANAALVRILAKEHPIAWLVGHHEAQAMACADVFRELDPDYSTFARDPGDSFVLAVEKQVANLGLKRATCP